MTRRHVVVILEQEADSMPEVVGPYRSKDLADAEADRWNRPHSGYVATVRPLERGPALRRYLGVPAR